MNHESDEMLEARAREERNSLHEIASELKNKVAQSRENLSVNRQAQRHFIGASAGITILGFILGYGITGIFTHR